MSELNKYEDIAWKIQNLYHTGEYLDEIIVILRKAFPPPGEDEKEMCTLLEGDIADHWLGEYPEWSKIHAAWVKRLSVYTRKKQVEMAQEIRAAIEKERIVFCEDDPYPASDRRYNIAIDDGLSAIDAVLNNLPTSTE